MGYNKVGKEQGDMTWEAKTKYGDRRRSRRSDEFLREASEVDLLWDRHREIARYVVKGYSNKEIGDILGVTPQIVSDVRNSPTVLKHIAELHAERDSTFVAQADEIRELVPQCIQVMRELTDEASKIAVEPTLRFKAAAHVLGIAGHSVKRDSASGTSTVLNLNQINILNQRARELALEDGLI